MLNSLNTLKRQPLLAAPFQNSSDIWNKIAFSIDFFNFVYWNNDTHIYTCFTLNIAMRECLNSKPPISAFEMTAAVFVLKCRFVQHFVSAAKSSARHHPPGRVICQPSWCSAAGGAETTSFNSASGFFQYNTQFQPDGLLASLNVVASSYLMMEESSFGGRRAHCCAPALYNLRRCHMTRVAHYGYH